MPKKKPNADEAAETTAAPTSKTQFVLSIPFETPADEVVAKAAATGIELTKQYVYIIRSKSKSAGKRKRAKRTSSASAAAPKGAVASPRGGSLDVQFANIIAEIGLTRAEALLKTVRATFPSAAI